MGNVAKYQHGWNMTFTVVELLMIIPKSTYLSISLPYFSIYHFFSLTLFQKNMKLKCNQYLTPVALYGFGRNGDPRPALFRGRLLFHPLFSQAGRLYAAAIQGAGGISPEKRFVSPDL